jgi:hypothetical protein
LKLQLPVKFQQLTTTAEETSFCSMNDVMRDNVICGTGMSNKTVTFPVPGGDDITTVPQLLFTIIKQFFISDVEQSDKAVYQVNLL